MSFRVKHYLDQHKYTHTVSKPFLCEICSYTCVKKDTMRNHILHSHGEQALPSDMLVKKKRSLRLYELPADEQVKLVGYTTAAPAKTVKLKDIKPVTSQPKIQPASSGNQSLTVRAVSEAASTVSTRAQPITITIDQLPMFLRTVQQPMA